MDEQILADLQQAYEWIVFIKDNILPIVLSSLAAIIAAIGGVSAMLSNVRSKTKKEALTTSELNSNTIAMIQAFKNEYKVIDARLRDILDRWDNMQKEFDNVKDIHEQMAMIKTSIEFIANNDKEMIKNGTSKKIFEEMEVQK